MEQIELPDVTIKRTKEGLLVTHRKSKAHITISVEALQRWLLRQLRSIF